MRLLWAHFLFSAFIPACGRATAECTGGGNSALFLCTDKVSATDRKARAGCQGDMAKSQIKSRERVSKHAEVFTAEREVNAMLDLVKQETERLDSRFLEPACGTGNFLAEILRRKLEVAKRASIPPGKKLVNPEKFERSSIVALTSIYGVELLMDNVIECRERLYKQWLAEYVNVRKKQPAEKVCNAARFILEKNIVCGNALSMKKVDADAKDTDEPIIFSEWAFIGEYKVKRTDYRFDRLLAGEYHRPKSVTPTKKKPSQGDLFGQDEPEDEGEIVKQYRILPHYMRIGDYAE